MRDRVGTTLSPPMQLTLPSRPTVTFGLRITPQQQSALRRLAGDLDCAPATLARLALAHGLEHIARDHRNLEAQEG